MILEEPYYMTTEYEHYYDGISPELQKKLDNMTPAEREADLEAEKKKCDEIKEW